jgi:hypothetical protein
MFLKYLTYLILFILSSSPVSAQGVREIIYSSCSRNNEIWVSDIKTLVEAIRSENKKIRAENISDEDRERRSKQFAKEVKNFYDDIVFKRKGYGKENSSSNEKTEQIYRLTIDFKSAAVYHAVGEILSNKHELSDIRVSRIFIEKCESGVDK